MASLPLLPGYTFSDPTHQDYSLSHKFDVKNGFRVIRDSNVGIGKRPIDAASLAYTEDPNIVQYDPSLTYGRVRRYACQRFVPHYARFAQKCLCFKAFFRQGVFNSPNEHFRVRKVNIIYFLEDDTVTVMEPRVDDAGFPQGRLVRRARIPRNQEGNLFSWKDFNVGANVCIYGVVYRIVDCDDFTKEFLASQGIDVGDSEQMPIDPYTETRRQTCRTPERVTRILDDPRRRFLEYDNMVLSFDATWNDDSYQILYFLSDDTIAVREIHKPNDGKDPVALLLKRTKVPKNWKGLPTNFPGIYMEYGDSEVTEYYTPQDFTIGNTIFIFGRRFLLCDCDNFTRKYYSGMLQFNQPEAIKLSSKEDRLIAKPEPPPHIKFGTPEDTFASCISFILKPPRKDVVRQLTNFPKKLRYSMQMDAVRAEDKNRDFVLEYSLSEGTISISETEKRNSGRREGIFLSPMLLKKPGTDSNNPSYYTPTDFYIGAKINVFNHHFAINGADLFVYRYMEANPDKFSTEIRDNVRNYFVRQGLLQDEIVSEAKTLAKESEPEVDEIADAQRKDEIDIDGCVKDFSEQAKEKYEGEHGELRVRTPPPEERCPNFTVPLKCESNERKSDSEQIVPRTSEGRNKEVHWAGQIDYDDKGHPVATCSPVHATCRDTVKWDTVGMKKNGFDAGGMIGDLS